MAEQVERELWLRSTLAELWEAITADGWLAEIVRLELTPGGDAAFAGPEGEREGWVEVVRPPAPGGGEALLAFWWAAAGEPASRVELELQRHGELTRLRVRESRPLELLDLVGTPLGIPGGRTYGPALVAA